MKHFAFTPIETPHGALSMEVHYNMSATLTLEQMRVPAAQPQIIFDYVGSQQVLPVLIRLCWAAMARCHDTACVALMPCTMPGPACGARYAGRPPISAAAAVWGCIQIKGSVQGHGPRSLTAAPLQRADTLLPDPVRSPPITTGQSTRAHELFASQAVHAHVCARARSNNCILRQPHSIHPASMHCGLLEGFGASTLK